MKNKKQTKRFTILSLLIAIEIVMSIVPFLGFIPLGFINATTLHIPVIIAGIILGKKEGAFLGFIFGFLSLIKATTEPNLTSFVFSPFITVGGVSGNFSSLFIVFVPRILLGFFSGLSFELFSKSNMKESLSIVLSSIIGSLTNTILVLISIYFFFGSSYADAIDISFGALLGFIMGLIGTSGLMEAIIAAILCLGICKSSRKIWKN